MYASTHIYDRSAEWFGVDDRTFFLACFEEAKRFAEENLGDIYELDVNEVKASTPIVHCTSLSGVKATSAVDRRKLHSDKARRKFVIADMDFAVDQVPMSHEVWEKAVTIAKELKTPIMTYPTVSYPGKPRWRLVLLTRRVMDANQYKKAVTWLFTQLGTAITDMSDLSMSVNRNLPIFRNKEQLESDFLYETFSDESLTPLDNDLWSDVRLERKRRKKRYGDEGVKVAECDAKALLAICPDFGLTPICSTYDMYWKVSQSFADAVLNGWLTEDDATECVKALAEKCDPTKKDMWAFSNELMLQRHMAEIETYDDDTRLAYVRPLWSYTELMPTFRFKSNDN